MQAAGVRTFIDRSCVGIHVDFKDGGKMYAPEWLVNRETNTIREPYRKGYTYLPPDLNVKELIYPDNDNAFSSSPQWT